MMSGNKLPRALYIASEWVPVAASATEPVINPATEELIGMAPVATKARA